MFEIIAMLASLLKPKAVAPQVESANLDGTPCIDPDGRTVPCSPQFP